MIVAHASDFHTWRDEARRLLAADVSPETLLWDDGVQVSLFGDAASPTVTQATKRVPRSFLSRARVACEHASPDRFAVLYRLLWKVTHGTPEALEDPLDLDAARLSAMIGDVHEEEHRMHAFVRFRPVPAADGEHWVGWFAPAHDVLARVAPFFARRYPSMRWSLFTPDQSAHWDGAAVTFGPGAPFAEAPPPDALDALFLTYYENVFNPARTNVPLLSRHIPQRIQAQLPEAVAMRRLAREAEGRVARMNQPRVSASEALLPAARDLASLAAAARSCRACPIGERATQVVFGEGPQDARLMIVAEQPGDEEDHAGRPLVGPSGRLFDQLLANVGLDRASLYLTNAVKHFKWEPRGKRRLHARPNTAEVDACRGWLLAEVHAVRPAMILCLGATAAQSFSGPGFRVQRDRGKPTATPWAPWWMATYHPSALLRAPDEAARRAMEAEVLEDLTLTRDEWLRVSGHAAVETFAIDGR